MSFKPEENCSCELLMTSSTHQFIEEASIFYILYETIKIIFNLFIFQKKKNHHKIIFKDFESTLS